MKAKWILLAAAAFAVSGCDTPKVEKYQFKAPQMPDTAPRPGQNKDLEKQLRETMKLMECKEADPVQISLVGNWEPSKLKVADGVEVPTAGRKEPGFKTAEGSKPKLVHFGCPEDLVKKEAGDLEIAALEKSNVAVGQKVLLCGKMPDASFLLVSAHTVLLKDFEFKAGGFANISFRTGDLRLEGKNKLTAVSTSGTFLATNGIEFRMEVESEVSGDGTLELESKTVTCAEVREKKAATP